MKDVMAGEGAAETRATAGDEAATEVDAVAGTRTEGMETGDVAGADGAEVTAGAAHDF